MKNITKILAVICALLMIVSLAACTKSETKDNGTTAAAEKASIVGSWTYKDGGYTYTFNEDGTGTYDAGGTLMKFTYTTTDTLLSIMYEGNTEPLELEYELDGSTLNVKDSLGNDTIYYKD